MVNVDKYLENYKTTKQARIAAMAKRAQDQGGGKGKAAKRATASAQPQRYPKGRCLIRGRILSIEHKPQYKHYETKRRMTVVCENGFVVIGTYPNKYEREKIGAGAVVQFLATFPDICVNPYAYFTIPRVADSKYDGVECFTRFNSRV